MRVAHLGTQQGASFHVALVEDVTGKCLYLFRDVPSLVFGNALADVFQEEGQDGGVGGESLNEAVHGLGENLVTVQLDVEVGAELQFAGQVAHDGLEEGVDGLYPESSIVMQQGQ